MNLSTNVKVRAQSDQDIHKFSIFRAEMSDSLDLGTRRNAAACSTVILIASD